MSKKQELIERRAKIIKQAQKLANGADFDAERNQEFNRMMDDAQALQVQIDAIAKSNEALAKLSDPVGILSGKNDPEKSANQLGEEKALYGSVLDKYMRFGMLALSADEQGFLKRGYGNIDPKAAQSAGVDTAGGYTVPEGFMSEVDVAQLEFNALRQAGAVIMPTDTGSTIPWPTVNDSANKGRRVGENAASQQTDLTFGAVNLEAFTYTSDVILVSNELLQDAGVDLQGLIAQLAGERVGRITNEEFTTGTGTSQPMGVVTGAADSGVVAAATGAVTFEELVDLKFSVNTAYRKSAACGFMFSDATLRDIAKMKDGENRPLLLPSIRDGEGDRVLGHRFTVNDDMADMAAAAKSILFGDFSKYKIRDVRGGILRRLSERYADSNQTAFILFTRHDGKLIDAGTHPIKYLTMAAS